MNDSPASNKVGMRRTTKLAFQAAASAALVSDVDFAELAVRAWNATPGQRREQLKRQYAKELQKRNA